jgi:uncharacterized protein (TIGR02118 family)
MVKLIFLFRRKSGTTFQQFREYYEHNHVPLAGRLLPYFKSYKRNYIRHDQDYRPSGTGRKIDFDVITELTFASASEYERMRQALSDPAVLGQIVRDEENFMDRSEEGRMMFFVDEEESDAETLKDQRMPING